MKTGIENSLGDVFTALVNGTYQGLLLTLAVFIYLRFARSINAATRHALLMSTLVVVTLLPVIHWILPSSSVSQEAVPTLGTASAASRAPVAPARPMRVSPKRGIHPGSRTSAPSNSVAPLARNHPDPIDVQRSAIIDSTLPVLQKSLTETVHQESASPALSNRFQTVPGDTAEDSRFRSWWTSLTASPAGWTASIAGRKWSAVMTLGWMGLALGLLLRLAFQYLQLWRLKRTSGLPQPGDLELFQAVADGLELRRSPRLLISQRISIPLAAGFVRPAVILPSDLAESMNREALRAVLRHELAHLARRDDWSNLFQLAAQAFYFFHPSVWLLSRRLNVEREIACDDHVLQATASPRDYALLLTEFVRRRSGRPWVTASGAWSHKSQLKERIDMILNSQRNTSPLPSRVRVGALTVGAVILAMAGLRIGPRIALADAPPTAVPTPAGGAEAAPGAAVQAVNTPVILPLATTIQSTVTIARSDSPDALSSGKPIGSTESGPRSKDTLPDAPQAAPAPKVAPVPPTPSAPPGQLTEESSQESLDQRLARLEKLVHELLQRDQPQPSAGAEMEKVVRQLQTEAHRMELTARNSAKAGLAHEITVNSTGTHPEMTDELEAKLEAEQARREADEAQREAAEEARQAEVEAKQSAMEAKQEAEQAQREAEEERRQALEEAKQAEREARQAEVEAAREKLQEEREHRKELKEQRKALLDEQAELKKRLHDIENELSHLKLPGDDVSPSKK